MRPPFCRAAAIPGERSPGGHPTERMKTAVKPFVVLVVLAAAACLVSASWSVPGDDYAALRNGLAAFALLGFLSEASYLRLRVGDAETQSSIAFIPFIASAFLFDTGWAAALAGFAMVVVEYLVKKMI